MEAQKRTQLLEEYAAGPQRVREFIEGVPKEAVDYRPFDDAWTMAEHVHHLLDAEINGFARYRFAIAEPGTTVLNWNQEGWKEHLAYAAQDLETSLEAFDVIRAIAHRHLTAIAGEDWTKFTFRHPERGMLDLDAWLEIYTGHVRTHIEYLERNLKAFKGR